MRHTTKHSMKPYSSSPPFLSECGKACRPREIKLRDVGRCSTHTKGFREWSKSKLSTSTPSQVFWPKTSIHCHSVIQNWPLLVRSPQRHPGCVFHQSVSALSIKRSPYLPLSKSWLSRWSVDRNPYWGLGSRACLNWPRPYTCLWC